MLQDRQCENKELKKYYRIGVFSQMNRITVKTLRYYDEVGLLGPEYVDEDSGYRYYTSSQLPKLHKILALREMNLSIAEIKEVLLGKSEEKILMLKKSQLLKELSQITHKLGCIESYLSDDFLKSDYRIVMRSLPEVITASKHVHLAGYEDLLNEMPDMGKEMEEVGCECVEPTYCFNIYHDGEYREANIHAEICEAVTKKLPDTETLKFIVRPEIKLAACILHRGTYETLPKAYSAIVQFVEESGYEIIGQLRESYIDGVWNKDSIDEWLTEIQVPVQKI